MTSSTQQHSDASERTYAPELPLLAVARRKRQAAERSIRRAEQLEREAVAMEREADERRRLVGGSR